MNPFTKMLFLELTNKQFVKMANDDYYTTWRVLTEQEKQKFGELSREIHQIWTHLNSKSIPELFKKSATTVAEYNELIERISPEILDVVRDFNLTLYNEMDPTFKEAYIRLFGKESFDRNFQDD
jgi:predicted transcriptional regulator